MKIPLFIISLFLVHFHVPAAFVGSGVPDEAVGLIGDLLDDVGIDIVTAVGIYHQLTVG